MVNKKAQGHVELILSFVIFIGFILAMLFFLIPYKNNNSIQGDLDNAQKILIDNITINYLETSLILEPGVSLSGDYFVVDNYFSINKNIVVLDEDGNKKNAEVEGGNIKIQGAGDKRYYKLLFSDLFANIVLTGTSQTLQPAEYEFGILSNSSTVFYDYLLVLNESYYFDYESLKESLNLKNDFGFVVYDSSNQVVFSALRENRAKAGVASRNIPISVINQNAERLNFLINIRTW